MLGFLFGSPTASGARLRELLVLWRVALWCLVAGPALVSLVGCMSFHQGPIAGEPKDARFMQLDGARVRYTDEGKGPPVVLLHGFASSLDAWETVTPRLVTSHRVIALDLKGFGWTDRPAGDYSPRAQAQLVLQLLDRLGVKRTAVVAHSWGSSVALALALMVPERVSRIALYDAWVYEEQLPTTFLWARAGGMGEVLFGMFYTELPDEKVALAFHDERYVTEELVETVEDQIARPGTTAAALEAVRGQRYEEMQKRYREIQQPVLLLWGREDRVTPLEYGERLSLDLPHADLKVYPQCGHFPMIEAKNPSNDDLVAFLADDRAPEESPTPDPAPPPAVAPAPAPADPPPPPPEPVEDNPFVEPDDEG
ncbi:MAG: alpha/beta fold hydrolase [Polyangiaceae bacterium]